jgi:hypothetical protein
MQAKRRIPIIVKGRAGFIPLRNAMDNAVLPQNLDTNRTVLYG